MKKLSCLKQTVKTVNKRAYVILNIAEANYQSSTVVCRKCVKIRRRRFNDAATTTFIKLMSAKRWNILQQWPKARHCR